METSSLKTAIEINSVIEYAQERIDAIERLLTKSELSCEIENSSRRDKGWFVYSCHNTEKIKEMLLIDKQEAEKELAVLKEKLAAL